MKRHLEVVAIAIVMAASLSGCNGGSTPPPGTAENLKADYERINADLAQQKQEFEKQKLENDTTWRQRIHDKDEKVSELTIENASLRQRLITTESALNQKPLVDASQQRSLVWLHVTYLLITMAISCVLAVVLWAHANLRERMRFFLAQRSEGVKSLELIDGPT